jgi:hypothetical protein
LACGQIYRSRYGQSGLASGSPQLIGAAPRSRSTGRMLRCCNGGVSHKLERADMKAVIDFSYAAFVAAVIGIAVGGAAFSLVWLLHILKV